MRIAITDKASHEIVDMFTVSSLTSLISCLSPYPMAVGDTSKLWAGWKEAVNMRQLKEVNLLEHTVQMEDR